MSDVYITSAIRTAVGSLGKSLKNVRAEDLGSAVISESITKSNIKPSELDEIIFGQVLTGGSGQNPARQAAMKAGVPKEVPAYIVNQVCGSGIRSIASGYQSIKTGNSKIYGVQYYFKPYPSDESISVNCYHFTLFLLIFKKIFC